MAAASLDCLDRLTAIYDCFVTCLMFTDIFVVTGRMRRQLFERFRRQPSVALASILLIRTAACSGRSPRSGLLSSRSRHLRLLLNLRSRVVLLESRGRRQRTTSDTRRSPSRPQIRHQQQRPRFRSHESPRFVPSHQRSRCRPDTSLAKRFRPSDLSAQIATAVASRRLSAFNGRLPLRARSPAVTQRQSERLVSSSTCEWRRREIGQQYRAPRNVESRQDGVDSGARVWAHRLGGTRPFAAAT